jgi:hypothetical protein
MDTADVLRSLRVRKAEPAAGVEREPVAVTPQTLNDLTAERLEVMDSRIPGVAEPPGRATPVVEPQDMTTLEPRL